MKNVNVEPIVKFAKVAGRVLLAATAMCVANKFNEGASELCDIMTAKYSNAVNAIMDSPMFSSDKRNAISALKRDGDAEYYRAVIRIANDGELFGSDKVRMIEELS